MIAGSFHYSRPRYSKVAILYPEPTPGPLMCDIRGLPITKASAWRAIQKGMQCNGHRFVGMLELITRRVLASSINILLGHSAGPSALWHGRRIMPFDPIIFDHVLELLGI
jgi:hypothetical protein